MSPSSTRYPLRARPSNPSLYLPDILPHDRETIPWDVDFANTASAYDLCDSAYNPKSKKTRRVLTVCAPETWHRRGRKSMSRSTRTSSRLRTGAPDIAEKPDGGFRDDQPTENIAEVDESGPQVGSNSATPIAPSLSVDGVVLDDAGSIPGPYCNPVNQSSSHSTSRSSEVVQRTIDDEELDSLSTAEFQKPSTSLLETLSTVSTNLTGLATDIATTSSTPPSTPHIQDSRLPSPVISRPTPTPEPRSFDEAGDAGESASIAHLNAQINRLNEQNQWDREELLFAFAKQRDVENRLDAARIEIAGLKRAVNWGCGVMAAQETLIDQLRRNPTMVSTPDATEGGQDTQAGDGAGESHLPAYDLMASNLVLGGSWLDQSRPELGPGE